MSYEILFIVINSEFYEFLIKLNYMICHNNLILSWRRILYFLIMATFIQKCDLRPRSSNENIVGLFYFYKISKQTKITVKITK